MGQGSPQPPVRCGSSAEMGELHGGVQVCRAQHCHLQPPGWGGREYGLTCRDNGGSHPPRLPVCMLLFSLHPTQCSLWDLPTLVPTSPSFHTLRIPAVFPCPQPHTHSTPTPTYPLLPAVPHPPAPRVSQPRSPPPGHTCRAARRPSKNRSMTAATTARPRPPTRATARYGPARPGTALRAGRRHRAGCRERRSGPGEGEHPELLRPAPWRVGPRPEV